ncbi:MAG: SDR family NAD(P)-dependent oxidoreductase [Chthoniobacterales bacterium]
MSNLSATASKPTALVTGGAGEGIGHGITEALCAAGWAVLITDIDAARANIFTKRLKSEGALVASITLDVTEQDAPERSVQAALEHFGRLDGLVNNVGVGLTKLAGDVSDEEFLRLFHVDFMASFRFVRAALPALRKAKGSVVNIGSIHAVGSAKNYALYSAVKSSLEAFTRGLAVDYGKDGLRANIVHPGWVDSPQNDALLAKIFPDPKAWIGDFTELRQCIPRAIQAREVGELVAFLLGDKSQMITAQSICIDGGTTAMLWNNEKT